MRQACGCCPGPQSTAIHSLECFFPLPQINEGNARRNWVPLDGVVHQCHWNIKFQNNRGFVLLTSLSLAPQTVPGTLVQIHAEWSDDWLAHEEPHKGLSAFLWTGDLRARKKGLRMVCQTLSCCTSWLKCTQMRFQPKQVVLIFPTIVQTSVSLWFLLGKNQSLCFYVRTTAELAQSSLCQRREDLTFERNVCFLISPVHI